MATPLAAFPLLAAGSLPAGYSAAGCSVSYRLKAYREGDSEMLQTVHQFAVKQFRAAIESHRAKTLGGDTEWGKARESLTQRAGPGRAVGRVLEGSHGAEPGRTSWPGGSSRSPRNSGPSSGSRWGKLNRRADVLLNFYNECDARLAVMDRYNRDMEETRRLEELSGKADMVIAGAQGALAAIGEEFVREAQAVGRALGGLAEVQIKSLAGEAPLDNIEYLADRVIENSESEERAIGALDRGVQYPASLRIASSTSSGWGRIAFSSFGENATQVSSAATRRTGPSSHGNSSSAIRAATSAPIPKESASSCATITLLVRRTESATVSMSSGDSVLRSITSVLMPCRSSATRAASIVRFTSAPQVTTVRSRPLAHHLRLAEGDHEVRDPDPDSCCGPAGRGACVRGR